MRADSKVKLARSLIGMVVRQRRREARHRQRRGLQEHAARREVDRLFGQRQRHLSLDQLFAKLGIADQVLPKSRKVRGPPSGEPVAAVVARGEAEIGFQQVSELIHVAGVDYVGTIPAELQPGFTFAGALTRQAQEVEAATALLRFLNSPEAAPVITKAGLSPAVAQ